MPCLPLFSQNLASFFQIASLLRTRLSLKYPTLCIFQFQLDLYGAFELYIVKDTSVKDASINWWRKCFKATLWQACTYFQRYLYVVITVQMDKQKLNFNRDTHRFDNIVPKRKLTFFYLSCLCIISFSQILELCSYRYRVRINTEYIISFLF